MYVINCIMIAKSLQKEIHSFILKKITYVSFFVNFWLNAGIIEISQKDLVFFFFFYLVFLYLVLFSIMYCL